jgi:carbon monoxide dehydrogenase subunit G
MASVKGRIALAATPESVWSQVTDPRQLSRWWPKVVRVELDGPDAFTEVLTTDKGRDVRADFVIAEDDAPRRWRFVQELEETPFAAVLRESQTIIELQPLPNIGTELSITLERKARGLGRFGGPMMKRAAKRQLEEALDRLGEIHGTVN